MNVPNTDLYRFSHRPSHLDTLFEKALNAENLKDIDWQTSDA